MLEKKVSVNSYDDEEWRPLHFASSKGFAEIVRFLVRHLCDLPSVASAAALADGLSRTG